MNIICRLFGHSYILVPENQQPMGTTYKPRNMACTCCGQVVKLDYANACPSNPNGDPDVDANDCMEFGKEGVE